MRALKTNNSPREVDLGSYHLSSGSVAVKIIEYMAISFTLPIKIQQCQ